MTPVIAYAGMTHLGLNSALGGLEKGFPVVCFDLDQNLIDKLQKKQWPIVEPDLPELFDKYWDRVKFTADKDDLKKCDLLYIAADVPTDDRGNSDLSGIRHLIDEIIPVLDVTATLIILCQVPPGFTRGLSFPASRLFYQVETLIFGRAVERALYPERFIVGCANPKSFLPKSYQVLLEAFSCPILPMRYESAELSKIAINCCLVASVSVANTLADLSERIGADWNEISPALKLDRRIGAYSYLNPGLGLSGGNLERDLSTLLRFGESTGSETGVIESFVQNSKYRRDWVLRNLHKEVLAKKEDPVIGILGLAYKENTNSIKNSPSLSLINNLRSWQIRVFDPVVSGEGIDHPNLVLCESPTEAVKGVDVVIIMTPWPIFKELQLKEFLRMMRGHVVIDPYRMFCGQIENLAPLEYFNLGMPPVRVQVRKEIHV